MSKEKEKKQEQSKTEEQKKKELAQAFGIDLKDIEHVFLDNGREYFKFVNPKDKTVRMIENINYNNGMDIQFKSIQHELAFTQGQNKKENAQDIFEHNSQYNNIELKKQTWENACLYHYRFKTIEEYVLNKMVRLWPTNYLNGGKDGLTLDFFFKYNKRTPEKEEYAKYLLNKYNT